MSRNRCRSASSDVLRTRLSRRRLMHVAASVGAAGVLSGVSMPEAIAARQEDWPADAPDYASLQAAVEGEAARWNIPGMTAAVLHHGERFFAATGVTNVEHPVPVTPDTRFQIGSISKVFTATAVMALVDRGLLDLDTPVREWIPDLPLQRPDDYATLTLRHLLNHTTGFEGDYFFRTGDGDDALAAGIDRFDELHTWTRPGEVIAYCNTGFSLAGRVIEVVMGQTYESAVTDLILAPLGMNGTSFPSTDLVTWPTASGHSLPDRQAGNQVHRPWALPRFLNAAGGIVSTVDDLLTFAEMHMDNGRYDGARILSEEAALEMRVRRVESDHIDEGYGVGWNIVHADGVPLVNHGGATNGFRAWLLTVPEHRFAIAMLTNSDEGLRAEDAVERWALRHYLAIDTSDPQPVPMTADVLDAVTGRYERHDGIFDVWRVDDHLHIEHQPIVDDEPFSDLESEDLPPNTIDAWPASEHVFVAPGGAPLESVIEFFEAPLFGEGDALVPRQVLRQGGRIAQRTGEAPASGPAIDH